jgi:hypothetical protein
MEIAIRIATFERYSTASIIHISAQVTELPVKLNLAGTYLVPTGLRDVASVELSTSMRVINLNFGYPQHALDMSPNSHTRSGRLELPQMKQLTRIRTERTSNLQRTS